MFFPALLRINTIIIHLHSDLLKQLLNGQDSYLLQTIVKTGQPFLYEEICSADILQTVSEIMKTEAHPALQHFYYRVKAEQMICLFLHELLKRKSGTGYPVNITDLKTICALWEGLISDLTISPDLESLVAAAHMSVSKLNRLFKLVFGTTVCNYHQELNVSKAAELIRDKRYSVTAAGYELGFSNLSHFTRIFAKHLGMNPPKFSSGSSSML